jgi:hypothetical protein
VSEFKPGPKKVGGRVAGTPNKATETVGAICRRHGLDVAEAMVKIVLDHNNPPERRDNMLLQLAKYQYAQPKAFEISGSLGIDTSRQDQELEELRLKVKERIKERK